MSEEARAEARRRWPAYPTVGFSGAEDRQAAFIEGAVWQASRKPEAAPPEREALTVELNVNDRKVIRGIYLAVQERGEDYLYPDEERVGEQCVNLREDGTGSCIIGTLAVIEGLPTIRESHATNDASVWGVSDPVTYGMFNAQAAQDTGSSWGEALEEFDRLLIKEGVTQGQIDEIRKAT